MFNAPTYYPLFKENVDHEKELHKVLQSAQQFLNTCRSRKLTTYDTVKLRRWGISYRERKQLGIDIK